MGNIVIEPNLLNIVDAITAVTTTTTSEPISIAGAKRISMMLTRANHTSGSTTWTVEISMDGTTWDEYNMLIDHVTNTNVQDVVRTNQKVQGGNATEFMLVDTEYLAARYMRLKATVATDGTATGVVAIET